MTLFTCDRCGEDFSRKDSLLRHKKRRYPCDIIGSTDTSSRRRKCAFGNDFNKVKKIDDDNLFEDEASNGKKIPLMAMNFLVRNGNLLKQLKK